VAVRFGWSNFPACNLFNKAGLPSVPFRTDDFPLTTAPKQ
jgi:sialate O-acetylesterase